MNAFEIAVKMETDAIEFYTEAARKTNYPAGKKMFETVTVDEKKHLEIIRRLIEGLDVHAEEVHPMENIRTIFEQMKDEMMEKVQATRDELEAFKIAMHMEKEGVEFYKKLMSEAETGKERELFGRLAGEEERHHDIFANTYSFLKDTGNWFMWEEHSIVDGGTPWA